MCVRVCVCVCLVCVICATFVLHVFVTLRFAGTPQIVALAKKMLEMGILNVRKKKTKESDENKDTQTHLYDKEDICLVLAENALKSPSGRFGRFLPRVMGGESESAFMCCVFVSLCFFHFCMRFVIC